MAMSLIISLFRGQMSLGATLVAICLATHGNAREFTSPEFPYRLTIPPKWNISVSPTGVPVLFNYDPKLALPQNHIPDGGAEIYLVPFSLIRSTTKADTIEEWIRGSLDRWHSAIRIHPASDIRSGKSALTEVWRAEADYQVNGDVNEVQRENNCYFRLEGQSYHLMMHYTKGDHRERYFLSVFEMVLKSIEPR